MSYLWEISQVFSNVSENLQVSFWLRTNFRWDTFEKFHKCFSKLVKNLQVLFWLRKISDELPLKKFHKCFSNFSEKFTSPFFDLGVCMRFYFFEKITSSFFILTTMWVILLFERKKNHKSLTDALHYVGDSSLWEKKKSQVPYCYSTLCRWFFSLREKKSQVPFDT